VIAPAQGPLRRGADDRCAERLLVETREWRSAVIEVLLRKRRAARPRPGNSKQACPPGKGTERSMREPAEQDSGAGEGNRTLVCSLGSCRSTIELHPRRRRILRRFTAGGAARPSRWESPASMGDPRPGASLPEQQHWERRNTASDHDARTEAYRRKSGVSPEATAPRGARSCRTASEHKGRGTNRPHTHEATHRFDSGTRAHSGGSCGICRKVIARRD